MYTSRHISQILEFTLGAGKIRQKVYIFPDKHRDITVLYELDLVTIMHSMSKGSLCLAQGAASSGAS